MTKPTGAESFTDVTTGRLERRVVAPKWLVPKRILLDGDRLRWTWTPGQGWPGLTPDRLIEPATGLLEDFLRLRDAPDLHILQYAQRWGVLGLCEHDFPAQHPPEYWPTLAIEMHACSYVYDDPYGAQAPRRRARPRQGAPPPKHNARTWRYQRTDSHLCHTRGVYEAGWYLGKPWEPVEAWRTWARRAHALLAVAAALQAGARGAAADWRLATDLEMTTPPTAAEGGQLIAIYADYWLRAANVRPWPQFQDGMLRMTLGSDWGNSPLFGAIAVQIVLAISGAPGYVLCDACQTVYGPRRTPRAGERHYCQACRDRKMPQRYAAAQYRKSKAKVKNDR